MPPSPRELALLLGRSHSAFLALTQRGSAVTCEWKRYGKKAPWVLKVSRADRTLFYVTPKADAFEATVVLGERATEAALAGRVSKSVHAFIRGAKPYAEGRPVRVPVKDEADVAGVEQLVAVKPDPTGQTKAPSFPGRRLGSAREAAGGPARKGATGR